MKTCLEGVGKEKMFPQLYSNLLRKCVSSKISASAKCQHKPLAFSLSRARPLLLASASEFGYRFGGSATSSFNSTGHLLRSFSDLPAQVSIAPHTFPPKEPSPLAGAKESPRPFSPHHSVFSESEALTEVCW